MERHAPGDCKNIAAGCELSFGIGCALYWDNQQRWARENNAVCTQADWD